MRARVEQDVSSVSHRNVRISSGFSLCPFLVRGGREPWQSTVVNILHSKKTMCNSWMFLLHRWVLVRHDRGHSGQGFLEWDAAGGVEPQIKRKAKCEQVEEVLREH